MFKEHRMTLLVLVMLFTVLISAHTNLFEATLLSTRIGTLEASVATRQRSALARRLLEMKRNIAVPIVAILILNTAANTAGATLAGLYAAEALGAAAVPLFSVVFTLLILFVGEIMPKTLGVVHWRRLWPAIVWPLIFMKYVLYPAIYVTQQFANMFTGGQKYPGITEEEILAAVRMGATEGQITHDESLLVHNIIYLENKPVYEIMTPRTVIFSLDAQMSVKEASRTADGRGFTRIPIYEHDRENITGYIITHDLFSAKTLSRPDQPIRSIAKPITFVPETTDSLAVLTTFLKGRRHIAIVIDEYGGVAGLVTLEDLIETVLGREIVDETDTVVDLQERARQTTRQRPTP
jgi:CBS domain containing-hemolysin-like protein